MTEPNHDFIDDELYRDNSPHESLETVEESLRHTATEIVSSLGFSLSDSRISQEVVYDILRRRVTRSNPNPASRQFELLPSGRGVVPAVMGDANDRSSVPLSTFICLILLRN